MRNAGCPRPPGRALKPTYIKLAKAFADQSDEIVITRMEAERNDFPSKLFDVKGYPAIYLAPKVAPTAVTAAIWV